MTQVQKSPDDVMAAVLTRLKPTTPAARPERPVARPPWSVPGFDGKARVMTSFGLLPIEALRVRDEVRLPDGAFRKVAWIDQLRLDAGFLERHPEARPLLIGASAFGTGSPERSFLVSPGQLIHPGRQPGEARLVSELQDRSNILTRSSCTFIRYFLFHLGEPAEVQIEGLWCRVGP